MRRRGWARDGGRSTPHDRLQVLESAIDILRERAEYGTVVVEGARDLAALDWLGIGGLHYPLNLGRPFEVVLEELAGSPPPVVLLVDWDRTGGRLVKRLEENLRARVQLDLDCRRRLATACHSRCVEDVPAEFSTLRDLGR